MAKAKVGAAGIEYIQGALKRPKKENGHNHCNYLVATHRSAATESPDCQRLYTFDADRYKRTTPPTAKEMALHTKFKTCQQAARERAQDLTHMTQDQEAYREARKAANFKYHSFRGWMTGKAFENYKEETHSVVWPESL